MFRRKGVLPTSPRRVHRCGARFPVVPLSKLTILRVLQSHTHSKATMEMRGRAARVDGSVQVRGSTLDREDHNRRYKKVGELGRVQIYEDSQQISEKTSIQWRNLPPHRKDKDYLGHNPEQNHTTME